jgi:hypothetical protein
LFNEPPMGLPMASYAKTACACLNGGMCD